MKSSDRRESTKFWIDPQLNHLELLRATYYTYAFAPHTHDTYAIGVTETGAQAFTHQRTRHCIMPAGSVAIVHPGEVHTSCAASEQGWTYRMFYPGVELLQKAAAEVTHVERSGAIPFFPSPVVIDPDLAGAIRNLHMAFEDPTTSVLEREARLLWVLGFLILRHADDRPSLQRVTAEPVYIQQVREYLEQHISQAVTLGELASLVGMSPFHFLRMFRNTTGLSPHAYLLHIRIARAKQFLRSGMPLSAVAVETGFVDQSHFSKSFKRVVGISPGQYR